MKQNSTSTLPSTKPVDAPPTRLADLPNEAWSQLGYYLGVSGIQALWKSGAPDLQATISQVVFRTLSGCISLGALHVERSDLQVNLHLALRTQKLQLKTATHSGTPVTAIMRANYFLASLLLLDPSQRQAARELAIVGRPTWLRFVPKLDGLTLIANPSGYSFEEPGSHAIADAFSLSPDTSMSGLVRMANENHPAPNLSSSSDQKVPSPAKGALATSYSSQNAREEPSHLAGDNLDRLRLNAFPSANFFYGLERLRSLSLSFLYFGGKLTIDLTCAPCLTALTLKLDLPKNSPAPPSVSLVAGVNLTSMFLSVRTTHLQKASFDLAGVPNLETLELLGVSWTSVWNSNKEVLNRTLRTLELSNLFFTEDAWDLTWPPALTRMDLQTLYYQGVEISRDPRTASTYPAFMGRRRYLNPLNLPATLKYLLYLEDRYDNYFYNLPFEPPASMVSQWSAGKPGSKQAPGALALPQYSNSGRLDLMPIGLCISAATLQGQTFPCREVVSWSCTGQNSTLEDVTPFPETLKLLEFTCRQGATESCLKHPLFDLVFSSARRLLPSDSTIAKSYLKDAKRCLPDLCEILPQLLDDIVWTGEWPVLLPLPSASAGKTYDLFALLIETMSTVLGLGSSLPRTDRQWQELVARFQTVTNLRVPEVNWALTTMPPNTRSLQLGVKPNWDVSSLKHSRFGMETAIFDPNSPTLHPTSSLYFSNSTTVPRALESEFTAISDCIFSVPSDNPDWIVNITHLEVRGADPALLSNFASWPLENVKWLIVTIDDSIQFMPTTIKFNDMNRITKVEEFVFHAPQGLLSFTNDPLPKLPLLKSMSICQTISLHQIERLKEEAAPSLNKFEIVALERYNPVPHITDFVTHVSYMQACADEDPSTHSEVTSDETLCIGMFNRLAALNPPTDPIPLTPGLRIFSLLTPPTLAKLDLKFLENYVNTLYPSLVFKTKSFNLPTNLSNWTLSNSIKKLDLSEDMTDVNFLHDQTNLRWTARNGRALKIDLRTLKLPSQLTTLVLTEMEDMVEDLFDLLPGTLTKLHIFNLWAGNPAPEKRALRKAKLPPPQIRDIYAPNIYLLVRGRAPLCDWPTTLIRLVCSASETSYMIFPPSITTAIINKHVFKFALSQSLETPKHSKQTPVAALPPTLYELPHNSSSGILSELPSPMDSFKTLKKDDKR